MNRHSAAKPPSAPRPPSIEERGNPPAETGKRARILAAAVRVFADKGFYLAKVSDIARPLVARALSGAIAGLALAWLLRRRAAAGKEGLSRVAEQLGDLIINGLRSGVSHGRSPAPPRLPVGEASAPGDDASAASHK